MQVLVEHNPYQGSLQVLVNGQSRPRLSKYANKPFNVWYKELFTILDGETNEPYSLRFIGGNSEIEIVKHLVKMTKYCKNISTESLSDNTSIVDRLNTISGISKEIVNVRICILPSLCEKIDFSTIKRALIGPDFHNIAWDICVDVCKPTDISNNPNSSDYLYIISEKKQEIVSPILDLVRKGYYSEVCYLIADNQNSIEFIGSNIAWHCTVGAIITSLTCHIRAFIIGDLFCSLFSKVSDQQKKGSAFRIKEPPKIIIPNVIEQGVDTHLDVIYPAGRISGVDISSRNPSIIKVSGETIIGVSEGVTNIQVFEAGTNQLLLSKDVKVRIVPRIREIYPDDVAIRHGENLIVNAGESFTIPFSYGPPNAENLNDISWSSSNSAIASVHRKSGVITAKRQGRCTITCEAGSADFDVSIVIKPALQDIEIKNLYGSEVVLNTGENYELNWMCIPNNANYGNISVRSLDDSIVGTSNDGHNLRAISEGVATIVLEDDIYHVKKELTIRVLNCEKPKKGLLSRIFSK